MTTATAPTFQLLPLATLHESTLNPRRTFDPAALEELAGSIRKVGILQPLTVRPNGTGYEIGAGHRRFRAAKLAGLTDVPAIVKPLDDVAFLELLVFENDHRVDVHPLEEAEGYRSLMRHAKYTVDQIAERLGRSVKYVYDRVKLLSLTKEAQALFRDGQITAGHAILLARLKPEDQRRVIGDATDEYEDGGLFTHEHLLWDVDSEAYDQALGQIKPVSVRELAAWIDKHVRFDAAVADPVLFPETTQRVAAAREEAEKVVAITQEGQLAPEAKDPKTRTYGPNAWKRADGTAGAKRCDAAVTGVVVIGPGRGEAFKVCLDKKGCKVHWAEERKVARAAARDSSGEAWKQEQERRRAQQSAAEAQRARWQKAQSAVLEAVAAKVKKAPARAGGLCADIVLTAVQGYDGGALKRAEALVPRGKTAEDLVRHAAFVVLQREAEREWDAYERFPKRAKAFGVDVKKLLDQVAPVQTAAEAKPAAGKGKKA